MACRQMQARSVVATAALLLASCTGGPAPEDPLGQAEFDVPLKHLPVAFNRASACSPLTDYSPPPAGSTFIYRRPDGSESRREIVAASPLGATFRYRLAAAAEALPPQGVDLGFLLAGSTQTGSRTVSYETAPQLVLSDLQPGRTTVLPTQERSTFAGRKLTLDLPTLIRFEGCGMLTVHDQSEFVRIYRVSRGRRVRQDGEDRILRTTTTYYLSERWGFPLVFEDEGITVLDRIITTRAPEPT